MENQMDIDFDTTEKTLFITNQCNSNCVMCPDSENARRRASTITLESLTEQIESFPKDIDFLCITGGEPTLLRYDLLKILKRCRERFKNTDFLLLTNGRSFSDIEYVQNFQESIPSLLLVGIPIYGVTQEEHDEITRTKGSFKQTLKGIENLLSNGVSVEIRVVVMKQNYKNLEMISRFIVEHFPKTVRVNFMGLEILGCALQNKPSVWINYNEAVSYIKPAALYLISHGIDCQIYNFPLCYVEKSLWSLCRRSISKEKVRFSEGCGLCRAKTACGGFFASTLAVIKPEITAIL